MRVSQIKTDVEAVKMHIAGGHGNRAMGELEAMSSRYTSLPERDYVRGELLRNHIAIPECFGGRDLSGFYKELSDRMLHP